MAGGCYFYHHVQVNLKEDPLNNQAAGQAGRAFWGASRQRAEHPRKADQRAMLVLPFFPRPQSFCLMEQNLFTNLL